MLTGGAFSNATLFAMGVSPYINSSIIMPVSYTHLLKRVRHPQR